MPVVIYSTSDAPEDVDETFALGANLFVQKPADIHILRDTLEMVMTLYRSGQLTGRDRGNFLLPALRDFH